MKAPLIHVREVLVQFAGVLLWCSGDGCEENAIVGYPELLEPQKILDGLEKLGWTLGMAPLQELADVSPEDFDLAVGMPFCPACSARVMARVFGQVGELS